MPHPQITVLGAGSWGTALALLLANNGNTVSLWGHNPEHMRDMANGRVNARYLPDCPFPDNLHILTDLTAPLSRDILIAVPSFAFRALLEKLKTKLSPESRIAWATKGIDAERHQLLHEVVQELLSHQPAMAMISGPSFAKEVAVGKPTAVTLAGNDPDFLQDFVSYCHNPMFRVYTNDDMVGVELCGVVKNVLAIAAGIADGMQLGANARSALITRGLAEMRRLNLALGGKEQTLLGLAGVGDLILTCTVDLSRNRRFGLALGRGESLEDAKTGVGQVVEGFYNTQQVFALAQQYQVEMPIVTQVYRILTHAVAPQAALKNLLARDPTSES